MLRDLDADQLMQRLDTPPGPHVLLLRTSLGLDGGGQPCVGAAAGVGPIGLWDLAALLDRRRCPDLRVVVVEPHFRADSAHILTDLLDLASDAATTALCWPHAVELADTHRSIRAFVEALAQSGDVLAARDAARKAALGAARSPLLVMRGTAPVVFDLSRRSLRPTATPPTAPSLSAEQTLLFQHLSQVLSRPGAASLFVGNAPVGSAGGALVRELTRRLQAADHTSLARTLQHFEMLEDREELRALVQDALEDAREERNAGSDALLGGLTRLCAPGLVVSLTLLPVVADALALNHPDRDIMVLQPLRPGDPGRLRVFERPAGERRWRRGDPTATQSLDFTRQHVVLRLHGGIPTPGRSLLGDPVLTETDQLDHLAALDTIPARLLAHFRRNPVVFYGFSPEDWAHRAIVSGLTGHQPLAEDSLAVHLPEASTVHRRYWTWSRGPAGTRGVRQVSFDDLKALSTMLSVGR